MGWSFPSGWVAHLLVSVPDGDLYKIAPGGLSGLLVRLLLSDCREENTPVVIAVVCKDLDVRVNRISDMPKFTSDTHNVTQFGHPRRHDIAAMLCYEKMTVSTSSE